MADEQAQEKAAAAAAHAGLLGVVFTSFLNFLPLLHSVVDGLRGLCLPCELLILCPPASSSGLSTKIPTLSTRGLMGFQTSAPSKF